MAKSYFAILGVPANASPEEIRSAYRRLAKRYHPDHYMGDSGTFRQIQEAYAVLGDSRNRRRYQATFEQTQDNRPARPPAPPTYGRPEPLIPNSEPEPLRPEEPVYPRARGTRHPSLDELLYWLWRL